MMMLLRKARSIQSVIVTACLWIMLLAPRKTFGFVSVLPPSIPRVHFMSTNGDSNSDIQAAVDDEESPVGSELDPRAIALKAELIALAERTQKGFRATALERKQARDIIFELARYNPTQEPAFPYYANKNNNNYRNNNSLAGKWNLIFTDAPDITGLDTSQSPFPSTAKLGRIGQECEPPYIKNVIEWLRPDWAANLPFSGTEDSRVLQKVVTSATASPDKPCIVELKVAGLELESGTASSSSNDDGDIVSAIEQQGMPAGILSKRPVDLKGPLNPPFGQFEILYLDHEMRMIKTGQNLVAVNLRIQDGEEWF